MEREDMEEERRGGDGGEEGGGLIPPSSVSADSAYAVRWAHRGLLLCEMMGEDDDIVSVEAPGGIRNSRLSS